MSHVVYRFLTVNKIATITSLSLHHLNSPANSTGFSTAQKRRFLIWQSHGTSQKHITCKHGQDDLLKFKLGEKGDFRDSECGTIVGARQTGLRISEIPADQKLFYWDFPTFSVGFTKDSLKTRKYPVSSSSQGENASLVPEVRGE